MFEQFARVDDYSSSLQILFALAAWQTRRNCLTAIGTYSPRAWQRHHSPLSSTEKALDKSVVVRGQQAFIKTTTLAVPLADSSSGNSAAKFAARSGRYFSHARGRRETNPLVRPFHMPDCNRLNAAFRVVGCRTASRLVTRNRL